MKKIVMTTDRMDDESILINFDKVDKSTDETIADGGYVHVRKEKNAFVITVFNCYGDVVSLTNMPFAFKHQEGVSK